jgi:hypothetical protein
VLKQQAPAAEVPKAVEAEEKEEEAAAAEDKEHIRVRILRIRKKGGP